MATGDNLKVISRWRSYQTKLPSNARLKSTIAMTSFSSAITQAGMRRREEAKNQFARGAAEAAGFIGLGPTNLAVQNMHGVLLSMQEQAASSMQKFAVAAKKANLPSVDIRGNELPPGPALPTGVIAPSGSNLPLMLGIGAGIVVILLLVFRPQPAYGPGSYGY